MSRVCEDGTSARSNAEYTAAQVLPLVATCRHVGCPRGNARYDLTKSYQTVVPQVARVTINNAYSGPVDAAWATQRPVQPPGGVRWQHPELTLLRDLASLPAARPAERGWCSC